MIKAFQYEGCKINNLFTVMDETYSKVVNDLKAQMRILEVSLEEVDPTKKIEKLEDKFFDMKKDMKKEIDVIKKEYTKRGAGSMTNKNHENVNIDVSKELDNIRKEVDEMRKREKNNIDNRKQMNKNDENKKANQRERRISRENIELDKNQNESRTQNEYQNTKEYNVIAYYLREDSNDDMETRKQNDYLEVRYMLDEIGLQNIDIIKTSRIGKRKENWHVYPRPLVIRLKSKQEKWIVIGKSKLLKQTEDYNGIYLALDMNKEELERNKLLRTELIERRNNGENLMIKNGQIINKRKNRSETTYYGTQTYQSFQIGNNRR